MHELPDARVAETVAVVLRIVRDGQPLSAAVSRRVARLIRDAMQLPGNHETALRVAEAKFQTWAKGARHELRRLSEPQDR